MSEDKFTVMKSMVEVKMSPPQEVVNLIDLLTARRDRCLKEIALNYAFNDDYNFKEACKIAEKVEEINKLISLLANSFVTYRFNVAEDKGEEVDVRKRRGGYIE